MPIIRHGEYHPPAVRDRIARIYQRRGIPYPDDGMLSTTNGSTTTTIPQPSQVCSPHHHNHPQTILKQQGYRGVKKQRPLRIQCSEYSTQLRVETTVEYDLPAHIYPPKNAEPILMIDPEYVSTRKARHANPSNQSYSTVTHSGGSYSNQVSNPSSTASSTSSSGGFSNFLQSGSVSYSNGRSSKLLKSNKGSTGNSCNTSCYSCYYPNSPSSIVYSKSTASNNNSCSSNNNSNRAQQNSTAKKSTRTRQTQQQRTAKTAQEYIPQQRPVIQQQNSNQQQQSSRLYQQNSSSGTTTLVYQQPPPSYATATGLRNLATGSNRSSGVGGSGPITSSTSLSHYQQTQQQTGGAAHSHVAVHGVGVVNAPMVGAVVPSDLVPQMMSSAHIVRSRGSPKVRATTRRQHGANLPEYHQMRRPRANTVGSQPTFMGSAKANGAMQQQQQHSQYQTQPDIAADSLRFDQQKAELSGILRISQNEIDTALTVPTDTAAFQQILHLQKHQPQHHQLFPGILSSQENVDQYLKKHKQHQMLTSLSRQQHHSTRETLMDDHHRLEQVSAIPYNNIIPSSSDLSNSSNSNSSINEQHQTTAAVCLAAQMAAAAATFPSTGSLLTPSESMEQDPYPRSIGNSSTTIDDCLTSLNHVISNNTSRYFPINKSTSSSSTASSYDTAMLVDSTSSSTTTATSISPTSAHLANNSLLSNNNNPSYVEVYPDWNAFELSFRTEKAKSAARRPAASKQKKSYHHQTLSNSSDFNNGGNSRGSSSDFSADNFLIQDLNQMFRKVIASSGPPSNNQAMNLTTTPPKNSSAMSSRCPSPTLLSTQFLGVPTPPISNFSSSNSSSSLNSSAHFHNSNSVSSYMNSRFINNLCHLTNMNFNLVY